jgi:hypothetical protein
VIDVAAAHLLEGKLRCHHGLDRSRQNAHRRTSPRAHATALQDGRGVALGIDRDGDEEDPLREIGAETALSAAM